MVQELVTAYRKNVASRDLVNKLINDTIHSQHLSRADKIAQVGRHRQVLDRLDAKHREIAEQYRAYSEGSHHTYSGINGVKMANEI